MASPVVESKSNTVTNGSTAATTHTVTLPASISAGALLLAFGRTGATGAVSFPAGWTVAQDSSDASDDVSFWAYMNTVAAGTEGGTSITVTHGSAKLACVSISVTGAQNPATQAPQASTVAIGSSVNPNSTTVTPTGGSKDYLFISASFMGSGSSIVGVGGDSPTGYTVITSTNGSLPFYQNGTSGGSGATNAAVAISGKAATAASDDPSQWAMGATNPWTAWTVAVHPAAAGATTYTKAGYAREAA